MNMSNDWEGFSLERVVGRGAVGQVFLGHSTILHQPYAIKVCNFGTPLQKRAVIQELIFWIDLPGHSNIAPCHFFRSTEQRLAIFTDFYPEGSLERWLKEPRLRTPVEILRIGAMIARGAAFLHEAGFIHRDIKPRNILMTAEGAAHVTDFGIAAAQSAIPTFDPDTIRFRAATAAYRSPEQAYGSALGPPTDVWSWGVTMLQALIGEVTWLDGPDAGEVLKLYLAGRTPKRVAAPKLLLEVLEQSFQLYPDARPSMREVAERMERACQAFGVDLPETVVSPRAQPASPFPVGMPGETGNSWTAPAYWKALLQTHGANPQNQPVYGVVGARTARALADLAAYDETAPEMERQAALDGSFTGHWSSFLGQKAEIHSLLGDFGAALALLDRALLLGHSSAEGGDLQAPRLILGALVAKAVLLGQTGQSFAEAAAYEEAGQAVRSVEEPLSRAHFFRAIAFYLSKAGKREEALARLQEAEKELLNLDQATREVADARAKVYFVRGEITKQWGDKEEAVDHFGRAIALLAPFMNKPSSESDDSPEGSVRLALLEKMAALHGLRADLLATIGRTVEAIDDLKPAIEDLEELVAAGESQFETMTIAAYGTLGNAFLEAGHFQEAEAVFADVTPRMEKLVVQGGRQDLDQSLGNCYMDYASALEQLGRLDDAEVLVTSALSLFEARCKRAPDRESANDLARALVNRGGHLIDAGSAKSALQMFDRAMEVYAPYIWAPESADFEADIALARLGRGFALLVLNRIEECFVELRQAMPVIQREFERTKRRRLMVWIQYVRKFFGDRDWSEPDD